MGKDLFVPVVEEAKLSEIFLTIKNNYQYMSVKIMLEEIFEKYNDIDGNFIEQFQTKGFNARLLELYFFAYFDSENYLMDRSHKYPDFIVEKNRKKVAVEITTANGAYGKDGGVTINKNSTFSGENMSQFEYKEYLRNEVPPKFSSPLLEKLRKKYWEKEHCRNLPFAIAVEGFFEEGSLFHTSSALSDILYGVRYRSDGFNDFYPEKIDYHKKGEREIPSGLFFKPNKDWDDMDNISAIIFQNSATISKFRRMGWYKGYYNTANIIIREGYVFNTHKDALTPNRVVYDLSKAPFREEWGNDLVVLHNPNAKLPIPKGFFENAMDIWYENGEIYNSNPKSTYHFLNSSTQVSSWDILESGNLNIINITKYEFEKKNIYYKSKKNHIDMYWFYNLQDRNMSVFFATSKGGYGYKIYSTIEGAKSYKLHKKVELNNSNIDDVAKKMFQDMS